MCVQRGGEERIATHRVRPLLSILPNNIMKLLYMALCFDSVSDPACVRVSHTYDVVCSCPVG